MNCWKFDGLDVSFPAVKSIEDAWTEIGLAYFHTYMVPVLVNPSDQDDAMSGFSSAGAPRGVPSSTATDHKPNEPLRLLANKTWRPSGDQPMITFWLGWATAVTSRLPSTAMTKI